MSSKQNPKGAAPVTNPYARKRKEAPAAGKEGVTDTTASTSVLASNAATFSQAFVAIEDTPHYRDQIPQATEDPRVEQERAEQRAIDLQEAASDRDHHVLLQPHVLHVSTKQRGNGLLKHIRNVPFAFSKMVPDYIMSVTSCALFLSIKYHQLYPQYIHRRLGELKTDFKLRVLLVLVDVEDNAKALLNLNRLAVTNNLTLILAWSEQEAARYLETYKALHGKDASSIQKRESTNFIDQNADFLTACKPVNKTDASNLLVHFNTVKAVMAASKDELALCEGLGPVKVQKLYEALHAPFSKNLPAPLARESGERLRSTDRAVASAKSDDGDKEGGEGGTSKQDP